MFTVKRAGVLRRADDEATRRQADADTTHCFDARAVALARGVRHERPDRLQRRVGVRARAAGRACEGEQRYVVILVRNEGQSQLDQGNMG